MRKLIFLRITLVLLIICMNCGLNFSQKKMPNDANKLYEQFSKSIETNDTALFRKTLCRTSFVNMYNQIISIGETYPEGFMEGMRLALLDFDQFKYLNFKKNGSTINVYYMYMVDNVETSIITLRMVEEDNRLKLIDLKNRDAKDFIVNLGKKDYSFLDLKEFQPLGTVDPPQKMITHIDYLAKYDVFAYGYEISISVNGFPCGEIANSATSGTVIGGVNKGENTVELSIKKTDPKEEEIPMIGIRAYINHDEINVFYFNEDLEGTSIKRTFTVE